MPLDRAAPVGIIFAIIDSRHVHLFAGGQRKEPRRCFNPCKRPYSNIRLLPCVRHHFPPRSALVSCEPVGTKAGLRISSVVDLVIAIIGT